MSDMTKEELLALWDRKIDGTTVPPCVVVKAQQMLGLTWFPGQDWLVRSPGFGAVPCAKALVLAGLIAAAKAIVRQKYPMAYAEPDGRAEFWDIAECYSSDGVVYLLGSYVETEHEAWFSAAEIVSKEGVD